MKIYDCFTFFNELELLEVRLSELYDTVDFFVIAESDTSHTGLKKEYNLEKNLHIYNQYLDKIRYIKVNDMPETTDSWVRENFQRNALSRGLEDAEPEDLIIVSDLDEIPRSEMINLIKEDNQGWERFILNCPQFRHRLNYMKIYDRNNYPNIIVTRYNQFTCPQQEREYTFFWNHKPSDTVILDHGGWHFTYFGDDDRVKYKIQNFAHTELNIPDIIDNIDLEKILAEKRGFQPDLNEKFEYVIVDDYFPKAVTENMEKWKHLIIDGATTSVTDIYKYKTTMSLDEMINLTNARMTGFKVIIDHLKTKNNPIILETGMSRVPNTSWGTFLNNFKDDGMSTLIWDQFVTEYFGEIHSVDIDPMNIEYTKQFVNNANLYCMDSVEFLWIKKSELEKQQKYVDLLYLDSLDDPVHHLKELCTIMPRITKGTLVVVDDNYGRPNDRGVIITDLMNSFGVELIHNGIQKVWKF